MRLAVVVPICVGRDAISAAAAAQAALAAMLPGVDRVDLFAEWIDRPLTVPGHVVPGPSALLAHPRFRRADAAIFHWGIHCPTFDALTVTADHGPPTAVMFHNMTPAALFESPERAALMARSRVQLAHLVSLSLTWWTYSEENRRALVANDVDAPVRFVPFPITAPRPLVRPARTGPLRLLAIGRLDPAKGTDILVEAAGLLVAGRAPRFVLELVGNSTFSLPDFAPGLRRRIRELGLSPVVTISPDVDDDGLWARLERADVVVAPSRHEGLCVPVVEAYLAGCRVVAADGGNLRYLVHPPDPVVPAGDAAALAAAISSVCSQVLYGRSADRSAATSVTAAFSEATARRALVSALDELTSVESCSPYPWPAVLKGPGPDPAAA